MSIQNDNEYDCLVFNHCFINLGLTEWYPPPWIPDAEIFETCAEYFSGKTAFLRGTRAQLANIYIQAHSSKLF